MNAKLDLVGDAGPICGKVLLVYDSVLAGKQAKELFDRLEHRLGPEFQMHLRWWNTTMLEDSASAQAAVIEVVSAALIIIAVEGDQPLAAPVRSCLQRCASRPQAHGGALVVQLRGILKEDEEVASALCLLKNLAYQIGAGFFSAVVTLPVSEVDYFRESIHQRAEMPTPVLEFSYLCSSHANALASEILAIGVYTWPLAGVYPVSPPVHPKPHNHQQPQVLSLA